MKFDVLYNFISPVTGRILCDYNHVLVGNSQGIAIPSISIPISILPDLSLKNFWIGNTNNRPVECIVDLPICYAATTSNIVAIYNNGTDGIGATLTLGTGGILNIDGIYPPLGSLILIKNQILNYQNGVYIYTTNLPVIVLTRADFYDEPQEIRQGDGVSIQFGNTNELSTWVQIEIVATIGTDSIAYIGPMGPKGPKGPKGDTGNTGNAKDFGQNGAPSGSQGSGLAGLIGGLIGGALVNAGGYNGYSTLKGLPGAAGQSGKSTVFFDANINMAGGRVENIAQSPSADFDAVSARWVWDLLNDNVEIKWES